MVTATARADAAAFFRATVTGPATAPPLLLLNGLFAAQQSWDGALPYLQGYRVICFDARGQGQTPAATGCYALAQQVNDVLALLDALAIERCALVGLSNGGRVALALAAHAPERVSAVVAAHAFAAPTAVQRAVMASWLAAHRVGGGRLRFDVAAPWIWSEAAMRNAPELLQRYREAADRRERPAVESLILGATEGSMALNAIQAPTLLVSGEEDLLTPPASITATASRIAGAQTLVVPGAHAALLERPALFESHLLPFLETSGLWVGEEARDLV